MLPVEFVEDVDEFVVSVVLPFASVVFLCFLCFFVVVVLPFWSVEVVLLVELWVVSVVPVCDCASLCGIVLDELLCALWVSAGLAGVVACEIRCGVALVLLSGVVPLGVVLLSGVLVVELELALLLLELPLVP